MAFLGRGRLFKKPQQNQSDSDDDYGTQVLEAKPLTKRIADRLDGTYQPRSFVTASKQSQQEFYGDQKVISEKASSSKNRAVADTPLSTEEKNKLNAKIMKAEMMGNKKLAKKLKEVLELGYSEEPAEPVHDKSRRKHVESDIHSNQEGTSSRQEILLTKTDIRTGVTMPINMSKHGNNDADMSIRDMLAEERRTTAEDQLAAIGDDVNKKIAKTRLDAREDETFDDIFISSKSEKKSKKRKREKEEKDERRKRKHAIVQYVKEQRTLDSCPWCFESEVVHKYLMVAVGIKTYLAVPDRVPLVDGHLIIVPMQHSTSNVQMDEDVYAEMQLWRKGLVAMYRANTEESPDGDDCLFIENAHKVRQQQHMVVESIPLPREAGDMAPIYFKKAIDDIGGEWTRENRRLLDLSKKDLRHSVPRGFPYFAIDFGLQCGYAHVIEDEKSFPANFGYSIVGGMLDIDQSLWRKAQHHSIDDAIEYCRKMKQRWQPFDWTERAREAIAKQSE